MPNAIRVRFATNRNPVAGPDMFGPTYRDGNPKRYVTGSISVYRTSSLPDTGWAPDPSTLQTDPPIDAARFLTTAEGKDDIVAFAQDRAGAELVARQREPRAPSYGLVFLPGFDSKFSDSMSRAAQIADAYKAADVFCFSWPSQGVLSLPGYEEDRDAAVKSANAIADSLRKLFAFLAELKADRPTLHIVAHSMGNFALRNAIQLIPASDRGKTLFESAFLMAADEDDVALSKVNELRPLIVLAKKIQVYRNGGDLALTASQVIDGSSRLGLWGPRDLRRLPRSVTSIDCSDVGSTQGDNGETHFGHQYYRLSRWVIDDVVQVLAGKDPDQIEGRLPVIGDDADGRAWWIPYDSGAAAHVRTRQRTVSQQKRKPRKRKS